MRRKIAHPLPYSHFLRRLCGSYLMTLVIFNFERSSSVISNIAC